MRELSEGRTRGSSSGTGSIDRTSPHSLVPPALPCPRDPPRRVRHAYAVFGGFTPLQELHCIARTAGSKAQFAVALYLAMGHERFPELMQTVRRTGITMLMKLYSAAWHERYISFFISLVDLVRHHGGVLGPAFTVVECERALQNDALRSQLKQLRGGAAPNEVQLLFVFLTAAGRIVPTDVLDARSSA